MQIAINFKNDEIAKKVLWLLEHFEKEGVEIIEIDNSETEILHNFQEGLREVKLIKNQHLKSRAVEDLLSEL
jgi:hypothetical protein